MLKDDFKKCKYVVEYVGSLSQSNSLRETQLKTMNENVQNIEKSLGNVIIYNPDKWGYSQFRFYNEKPNMVTNKDVTVFEILHISR